MKNLTFETKDQYLAMRAQWAESSKSTKCKRYYEPCYEWLSGLERASEGTGRLYHKGWMKAQHHLLYNILRNKPVTNGFATSNKFGKPDAFHDAACYLATLNGLAKEVVKQRTPIMLRGKLRIREISQWQQDRIDRSTSNIETFLAPFGDTLTLKQFAEMDIIGIIKDVNQLATRQNVKTEQRITA